MLRAALIGFPSVGKTTLFHVMTSAHDLPRAAPRKAEPNVGIARVPDERLERLTAMYNPRKKVPATVEFVDPAIPGRDVQALVDAPAFRSADALLHVIRMFRNASIPHEPGPISPVRDAQAMESELILADLVVAERRIERIDRDMKKGAGRELQAERDVLMRCREALENGRPLRALDLAPDEMKRLRGFQFFSAKPLLLVLNLDEADLPNAARAPELAGLVEFLTGAATRAVPVCAKIEWEIGQLDKMDAAAFMADLGLAESGLDRVIRATYELLGYISFFTVGEDECRAWSIPRGLPAQVAAGEIHSDIARGFIRAEVVAYERLIGRGSYAACRDHGEVRLEGKEYVVADGDVINIRFAT
ncbi:MAG: redox-regulated ATPase YchF [Acidobacteria bacterium]|nr:redox-regulated ATPase YchF [Acidobacteriota bacterium]